MYIPYVRDVEKYRYRSTGRCIVTNLYRVIYVEVDTRVVTRVLVHRA